MTTGDLSWPLQRAALLRGGEPAVIDGDRTLSYDELARRVGSLGGALGRLGLGEGARVGYLGVNSLAHLECWLGVPAFGRVLADLNFRLAEAELAFMIEDAGVEVLVVDGGRLAVARALRERCADLRLLVLDAGACPDDCTPYESLVGGEPATAHALPPETLATISYTGGTTGTPKGVMLSHGNLLANARHNLITTGHRPEDRWLHVCPMFHVAGTSNVFASAWVGAVHVLLPRFEAGAVLGAFERHHVTHCALVPTMLAMLLDHPDFAATDLSSLRHIQYAASPISPELQRRVLDALGCDVAQFYGMTEAAPTVTHLSPEDHRGEPGRLASMGVPVPGVQVEVRGMDDAVLDAGEIGELWVRGPNIMLGYWHRRDATDAAIVDGWFRTGDLARSDERGYLYMVDRAKDMIISGAENVYSVEVEAALLEHEDVIEAAVFGVPHDEWGEAVHAVVTVRAGSAASVEDLVSHCRGRIAGFKMPRTIDVQTRPLPKSGAGKVLKSRLRKPFWQGRDRLVS